MDNVLKLDIKQESEIAGTRVMSITGLTPDMIAMLTELGYRDMIRKMVEILDKFAGNIGTCWQNGYGIYQMWITEDGVVHMEIGSNCD